MPPSIRRAGAGACSTTPGQARQASFGRLVTRTRNWAGITSSRLAVSTPISTNGPWQQGQVVASGGNTCSISRQMHGQAAAAGPATLLLLLADGRGPLGRLGGVLGQRRLDLLEGELQLLVGQPLRLSAELPTLQLQQQVAETLVLLDQRIALGGHAVAPGCQRVDLVQRLE